jgi:hypothetical protein
VPRQVTNRFDYGIQEGDHDTFYALMAAAAKQPHVWWIVNNPYDQLYLKT